jgi:hypothetical protein
MYAAILLRKICRIERPRIAQLGRSCTQCARQRSR